MRTDPTVASTILHQLSGFPNTGRLSAMIGAKSFVYDERSLKFKWSAKAKNGANTVIIQLDPSDTYSIEFWNVRGAKSRLVKSVDSVYGDQLRDYFEYATGLRTSL